MSREADYDMDLFAEMVRTGKFSQNAAAKMRDEDDAPPVEDD